MRVRLSPDETIVDVTEEERAELQAGFARSHYVRFRQLIDPDLARTLHDQIEAGGFRERVDEGIARELFALDGRAVGLLSLMVNDAAMRELVRMLVGRMPSVAIGRAYRFAASDGTHDDWHSDLEYGRLAALSLNLSPEPFEGSVLQIRDADTKQLLSETTNTGLGDAVLFRIDPSLEHRNTAIVGAKPKTAFAAFFAEAGDFASFVRSRSAVAVSD